MEKKIKNKRKGPDQISRTISLIIAISWVLIFILFIILALAKPTADWSITSIMSQNTQFSGGWNKSFIQILPPVLIVQVGLCVFGLLLSSRRMKRKSDKYSTSLIFFTITSIAGLLVYLVLFA